MELCKDKLNVKEVHVLQYEQFCSARVHANTTKRLKKSTHTQAGVTNLDDCAEAGGGQYLQCGSIRQGIF